MSAQHTGVLQALLVDKKFEGDIHINEPLSAHSTYRIGGPASFFVSVQTLRSLVQLIELCEKQAISWVIIGKGSNLLVADEGFDGVVIVLEKNFKTYSLDEERNVIVAGAAAMLSSVVQVAFKHSLSGLEFAVGTPGTIGGAIRMNAGSGKSALGEIVTSVTVYSPHVGLKKYQGNDISWSYRSCSIPENEVIIECELKLSSAKAFTVRPKMEAALNNRRKTQPMAEKSCGSVFKNPEGHFAAALIDQAGLKGTQIGGAQVSKKHANFIINTGGARASDVRALIELIQTKVKKTYGIELQPEVKFLGFSQ
jgi:UDP-N-acetylmuramate dehydrogenase